VFCSNEESFALHFINDSLHDQVNQFMTITILVLLAIAKNVFTTTVSDRPDHQYSLPRSYQATSQGELRKGRL